MNMSPDDSIGWIIALCDDVDFDSITKTLYNGNAGLHYRLAGEYAKSIIHSIDSLNKDELYELKLDSLIHIQHHWNDAKCLSRSIRVITAFNQALGINTSLKSNIDTDVDFVAHTEYFKLLYDSYLNNKIDEESLKLKFLYVVSSLDQGLLSLVSLTDESLHAYLTLGNELFPNMMNFEWWPEVYCWPEQIVPHLEKMPLFQEISKKEHDAFDILGLDFFERIKNHIQSKQLTTPIIAEKLFMEL